MKRTKKDTPAINKTVKRTGATDSATTSAAEIESIGKETRRLHVFFSGTVQGVGFRYTALSIAERFAIRGWVRNCADGRVELVAEGAQDVLENYLSAVGEEMSGYIRKVDRSWEKATNEFSAFAIAATV